MAERRFDSFVGQDIEFSYKMGLKGVTYLSLSTNFASCISVVSLVWPTNARGGGGMSALGIDRAIKITAYLVAAHPEKLIHLKSEWRSSEKLA